MKTGCVLMAAGAGHRFGGDKLITQIAGKTLLERILSILPLDRFDAAVTVAADSRLKRIAQSYGVSGVINGRPGLGICRSIRMGLNFLPDMDACMFCVCDQPLLKADTITGMLDAYSPGTILCLSSGGRRGNPVLFPSCLFVELKNLGPGESGKTVMGRHPELLRLYEIPDPLQLMDVDTKEQLAQVQRLLQEPDSPER